jgi:2-keto-3-deoxy-L-rhamnonate aldolase RhmA
MPVHDGPRIGGIQAPCLGCKSYGEKVVQSARFAPQGMRGVCRFVRAAGYSSLDRNEYFARANITLMILQLEGVWEVALFGSSSRFHACILSS